MIIGVCGLTEDKQGNRGSAYAGKDSVADRLVERHGFVKVSFGDEIKRTCMRLWDFSEEQLWGSKKEEPDERYPITASNHCCDGSVVGSKEWKKPRVCHRCGKVGGVAPSYPEGPCVIYLTPRHAMQQLGTEVGRAIDQDVWVRCALNVAKKLLSGQENLFYKPALGLMVKQVWGSAYLRGGFVARPKPKGVVIPDVRFPSEVEGIRAAGGRCVQVKRKLSVLTEGAYHASETSFTKKYEGMSYSLNNNGTLYDLHVRVDRMMENIKEWWA